MKVIVIISLLYCGINTYSIGFLSANEHWLVQSTKRNKSCNIGQPFKRLNQRPVLYWGGVASGGESDRKATNFYVKYPVGSRKSSGYELVSLQISLQRRVYFVFGPNLTEECLKAVQEIPAGEKLIVYARFKNRNQNIFHVQGEWVLK